jgi:ABC-type dipeptide/oligopeptide/nickel transport system permease subunit
MTGPLALVAWWFLIVVLMAILAPWLATRPIEIFKLNAPRSEKRLGTDNLGRIYLSIIYETCHAGGLITIRFN